MSNQYEFADVRFPSDHASLLKMTQDIIRANRRLVGMIGNLHYTIDALIDAVDSDDGHRLAQLVLEYKACQATAQAIIDAKKGAGVTTFP